MVSTPHCGCGNPSSILGLDIETLFFKYCMHPCTGRPGRLVIVVYNPRMLVLMLLIALVREFESRRGEILTMFAEIKKDQSTAESTWYEGHPSSVKYQAPRRTTIILVIGGNEARSQYLQ